MLEGNIINSTNGKFNRQIGDSWYCLTIVDIEHILKTNKNYTTAVLTLECTCGARFKVDSWQFRQRRTCGSSWCRLGTRRDKFYSNLIKKVACIYRVNAKKKGISWNLSVEQVEKIIMNNCTYCGLAAQESNTCKNHYVDLELRYNGIDRVDNTKGYSIDNCVACCKACNYMKSTMSIYDLSKYLDRLTNFKPNFDVWLNQYLKKD